jgi:hypothetical protein
MLFFSAAARRRMPMFKFWRLRKTLSPIPSQSWSRKTKISEKAWPVKNVSSKLL